MSIDYELHDETYQIIYYLKVGPTILSEYQEDYLTAESKEHAQQLWMETYRPPAGCKVHVVSVNRIYPM